MINQDKFIFLYRNSGLKTLDADSESGLRDLLLLLDHDPMITDPRWAVYMLATVYWECAGTWMPIEERGKGRGRKYGLPDRRTGLIYYGRGYTQNTWYENYKTLTDSWNKQHPDVPVDFTLHPELLLIPEYSYWVMSLAMRKGLYTGVGLPRYINADKYDFVNARRIINGVDKAHEIADIAEQIENIYVECQE